MSAETDKIQLENLIQIAKEKQNKLTPGGGISIVDDEISVIDSGNSKGFTLSTTQTQFPSGSGDYYLRLIPEGENVLELIDGYAYQSYKASDKYCNLIDATTFTDFDGLIKDHTYENISGLDGIFIHVDSMYLGKIFDSTGNLNTYLIIWPGIFNINGTPNEFCVIPMHDFYN